MGWGQEGKKKMGLEVCRSGPGGVGVGSSGTR